MEEARKVKIKYVEQLLKLANVTSVGIGLKVIGGQQTDEIAIVVGVTQKLPESLLDELDIVPKILEGVKTDVIEVGRIFAPPPIRKAEEVNRKERIRPVKGGYSIGNVKITAGTSGCVVKRGHELFVLSNAHVFTPDSTKKTATVKDIIQPGSYDGGTLENDKIGDLSDYIVINPTIDVNECSGARFVAWFLNGVSKLFKRRTRFNISSFAESRNLVDAALCRPLSVDIISTEVEGIGVPAGIVEAKIGQTVVKSGRTTTMTRGSIDQVDVTVNVGYGDSKTALFEDQVIVKGLNGQSFSSGGDSGSIVFIDDGSLLVCGLLFAGSDIENITIINRIQNVEELLNITIGS